ncbi:uncharacterized protein [Lolium perenne]|nr:EPIDERMAL PATTERNING FACTOR-like protein 4 isoform X2 [Lolium perenne]
MESSWGRWRWGGRCALMAVVAVCFVAAVSLCCVRLWDCGGSGCSGCTVALRSDFRRRTTASSANQVSSRASGQWRPRRRLLSRTEGPGSYPPRCASKCGSCSPCYPVHVAVPPGVPVTTEYYPEAWRCRCGNRLYMP